MIMDIKKYVKDNGLVDVLLIGSRTKPIYLEELLADFEQRLVKNLTIPRVIHCPECGAIGFDELRYKCTNIDCLNYSI